MRTANDNTVAIDPAHLAICERWFEAHKSIHCREVGDRIPTSEPTTLYGRTYRNGTHLRVWIAEDGRSEAHIFLDHHFEGRGRRYFDAIAF